MEKSKILVIDDEEVIRHLLLRTLEKRGYDVEVAEDGDVALKKMRGIFFNLLITDLKMPKIQGIDILKEIKKINPYIEVIIITGYPTIESAVEAIKIGAYDFICKPFDIEEIESIVSKCLEKQKITSNYIELSELMTLLETSRVLTANADLDSILNRILDSALRITEARGGAVMLYDNERKEFKIKASQGLNEEVIRSEKIGVNNGFPSNLTREGTAILVTDMEQNPLYLRDCKDNTKDFLEVPMVNVLLRSQEKVLGMINLFGKISGGTFTEREQILLSILASQATVGIENINLYQELQKKIEDLKNTIKHLNQAQTQLIQSEKLAALGRFSAGIAHEVKNPLAIILGGIEFLDKKLSRANIDTKVAIEKIKESTLRANTIVQNLLQFAKPSELRIERITVRDLINETLSLFKYRIHLTNIHIETQFIEQHIYIGVDKNQMQQVLFNIFMNAVEAMPKKGRIKVKVYKTTLAKISPDRLFCVIEIIDNGMGISKDDLARIFEPFFTTKRYKKGTGLGLPIAKKIIENHRGKLMVKSKLGKGTDIKIILPIVQ
jgi:signal transduction histidine kinase/ActR/RegA family two-component response regulator